MQFCSILLYGVITLLYSIDSNYVIEMFSFSILSLQFSVSFTVFFSFFFSFSSSIISSSSSPSPLISTSFSSPPLISTSFSSPPLISSSSSPPPITLSSLSSSHPSPSLFPFLYPFSFSSHFISSSYSPFHVYEFFEGLFSKFRTYNTNSFSFFNFSISFSRR